MGGRLSRRTNERRGEDNIVEALAVQFPDMFHAEILSKLGLEDTLTLSRVSKKGWRAVWSEAGVRRMKAMIDDLAEVEVWEDVRQLIDAKFPHLSGRNSAPHELAKARALSDHRLKDMKEQYSHKISMVVKKHETPYAPSVKTSRRWERDGGPSRFERFWMSRWFTTLLALSLFACFVAIIWLEVKFVSDVVHRLSRREKRYMDFWDRFCVN